MGFFYFLSGQDDPDPSIDKPYAGLQDALAQETLSQSEQRSLQFVSWSLAQGQRHFTEFPLDSSQPSQPSLQED